MSQASPLSPARRRAQELAASGDLAGARAILEKGVELGKANLAEDDPDLLQTAHQLGQLYQRLDDPSAARRVLEEAYAAGQLRLGDHDPLMVEISSEIGAVAEELGNRHEARKAFIRVAEYGPAALGANHQAVTRAQAYLGHTPDSVRSSAPPTATPAVSTNPPETHLTLVTPVPSASPFRVDEPTGPIPAPRAFVQPPPTTEPARRTLASLDEPTVARPIITPRQYSGPPSGPQTPAVFQQGAPHLPVQRPAEQRPGEQWIAEQWIAPPQLSPAIIVQSSRDDAYRKRGLGLFAAIAAVMASLIAVAALVFVLASRDNNPAPASNVPTLAGRAPSDLKLHDRGSEVELKWTDPSPGQVSFIVVMGHPGEELKPMTTLGPGTTSYRAGGLNAKLNYCFAVAAVYSAKTFATSPQSCTSRGSAATASSTGK